ncbi:FAD binding domain-containing protein [Loktanella sp. Alg231-35]|uniref:FAD binding domain-containing protein n=1 Tax=Loktanella sp. Alg231-35 TaxID=1922220 RepID=UPI000D55A129|nr:FAD binding domain-containing protein [Loktanella sp. Alg231-35]
MKPFQYSCPASLQEASEGLIHAIGDVRLLAGGTDLTVGLRHGHFQADTVLDLKRVVEMKPKITASQNEIVLSGFVAMTAIAQSDLINRHFQALAEAADVVGSRQIRNRATLIGNICNASPAADTVPVLAACGASVDIFGPQGARSMPVTAFIQGNRKIALAVGELVTAVRLPFKNGQTGTAFGRITRRRGVDLATVNLCCHIGATGLATFAFGAASPRPLVVTDTSGMLCDPNTTEDQIDAVIDGMVAQAKPISDVRASADYRVAMLKVLATRALATALQRQREALADV